MYYPNKQDNWDFYVWLVFQSFKNKLNPKKNDKWEKLNKLHLASNYDIIYI